MEKPKKCKTGELIHKKENLIARVKRKGSAPREEDKRGGRVKERMNRPAGFFLLRKTRKSFGIVWISVVLKYLMRIVKGGEISSMFGGKYLLIRREHLCGSVCHNKNQ